MIGWIVALLLAATAFLALAIIARAPAARLATAAAVLSALAGYAWQGSPGLPGHGSPPNAAPGGGDSLFALERGQWLPAYGHDADRLAYLDALERDGLTSEAAAEAQRLAAQTPRSMALALAFANAMFLRTGDAGLPPVVLAFERAARLAPEDPAPPYFFGLSLAQSGRFAEAAMIWRATLTTTKADARRAALIRTRLLALESIQSQSPDRQ